MVVLSKFFKLFSLTSSHYRIPHLTPGRWVDNDLKYFLSLSQADVFVSQRVTTRPVCRGAKGANASRSSSQGQSFGLKRGCFKGILGGKNKNFLCLAANFWIFPHNSIFLRERAEKGSIVLSFCLKEIELIKTAENILHNVLILAFNLSFFNKN